MPGVVPVRMQDELHGGQPKMREITANVMPDDNNELSGDFLFVMTAGDVLYGS